MHSKRFPVFLAIILLAFLPLGSGLAFKPEKSLLNEVKPILPNVASWESDKTDILNRIDEYKDSFEKAIESFEDVFLGSDEDSDNIINGLDERESSFEKEIESLEAQSLGSDEGSKNDSELNATLTRRKRSRYIDFATGSYDSLSYDYLPYYASDSSEEISSEQGNCPDNYISLNGNGCYHFSDDRLDFDSANSQCKRMRGYLAEVDNSQENELLKGYISRHNKNHHLLGATDRQQEGKWVWQHSKKPMEFLDWKTGEPNNHNGVQNCLVISGYSDFFFQWDDFYCDYKFHYVCETDLRSYTEPFHAEEECPQGYTNVGDQGCYFFHQKQDSDWFDGLLECAALGGYLAIIDNNAESSAIGSYLQSDPSDYYIGANDLEYEGRWVWSKNDELLTFNNWGYGEPNNAGEEDCASLKGYGGNRGRWNDEECHNQFGFICETDLRRKITGSKIPTGQECPTDYEQVEGRCYAVSPDGFEMDWYEGRDYCKSSGGYLAEIDSTEENKALFNLLGYNVRSPHYIGGKGIGDVESWIWDNSGKQIDYFKNNPHMNGYPEAEMCVMVFKIDDEWTWGSLQCGEEAPVICEADLINVIEPYTENVITSCEGPYERIGLGCYYISNEQQNWWTATETCRHLDEGHLVSLDDSYENEVIREYLLERKSGSGLVFWHGAYDLGHEGRWYWDSTRKPISFSDWKINEPNNHSGDQHCAGFSDKWHIRFQWDDIQCTDEYYFICEAPVKY